MRTTSARDLRTYWWAVFRWASIDSPIVARRADLSHGGKQRHGRQLSGPVLLEMPATVSQESQIQQNS